MFTANQNNIVKKVLGYYTFDGDGVTTIKPQSKQEIVAVKVLMIDDTEGAIPQVEIVDFQKLPDNC